VLTVMSTHCTHCTSSDTGQLAVLTVMRGHSHKFNMPLNDHVCHYNTLPPILPSLLPIHYPRLLLFLIHHAPFPVPALSQTKRVLPNQQCQTSNRRHPFSRRDSAPCMLVLQYQYLKYCLYPGSLVTNRKKQYTQLAVRMWAVTVILIPSGECQSDPAHVWPAPPQ